MKKLLFVVLTVLMVACSSDDDNSCDVSTASLIGTWAGVAVDPEVGDEYTVTIVFNNDGTASIDDEGDTEEFNWESNDSQITFSIDGFDLGILNYEFETCDEVNMYPDGDEANIVLFTRQ